MEVDGKVCDKVNENCEACRSEDSKVAADGYCNDCEEFLCNSCYNQHLKYRMSKNHILGPVAQGRGRRRCLTQAPVKCKTHTNEIVKFYCRKHDAVFCGDCLVLHHCLCGVDFICNLSDNFRENSEFKEFMQRLQILEKDCNQHEKTLNKNNMNNRASLGKILDSVRTFRKKFNDYLDHLEEEILSETNDVANDFEKQLSELQTKVTAVCSEVANIKLYLEACQSDNDLFISLTEAKQQIKDLELSISEVKKTNSLFPFTFEPHQKLKELISSNIKLGSLRNTVDIEEEKLGKEHFVEDKAVVAIPQTDVTATQTDPDLTKLLVYMPPDPRSEGFDFGKRVRRPNDNVQGTVTSIDPEGYVTVKWDNTFWSSIKEKAGVGGVFTVRLA